MKKNIVQYTFTCLWIVALAVALYVSMRWNSTTALFPHAVGFPMLVLLAVILVVDVRKARQKMGAAADDDREYGYRNARMLIYLGWLVGLAALVWAVGLIYALPLYLFGYMTIQGGYGWLKSALYAAVTTGFIFLLFQYAFRVSWPEGALLAWLAG